MNFIKKVGKIVLWIFIIVFILLVVRFVSMQYRMAMAQRKNAISKIVTYQLDGKEQTVLIEGKEEDLPLLVLLHGGPCFSTPFNEGCRGLFPELTNQYLTVYWDQFGCGRNRETFADGQHLPSDISIENYVQMTKDLLTNLRKEYPNRKVYLFGLSWGSVLTAKIADQYPELVDQVLVYGQVRGRMFQTDDVIDEVMNYCTDIKEKEFLLQCEEKAVLTDEEVFRIESDISKYTDGFIYFGRTGKKQSYSRLVSIVFQYFLSPDYTMRDAIGSLTDSSAAKEVAIEMIHSDLTDNLRNVKVPYKILQGERDLQTSRYQIEEFLEQNDNPNITYEIIPDCGHIPTTQCFSAIMEEIKAMND